MCLQLRAAGQNKHQLDTFPALLQSKSTEDKISLCLPYTFVLGTLLHGSMCLKKRKEELDLLYKYPVCGSCRRTRGWSAAHVDL
jgi:hypothetical protein